jgi:hypothetical protein
LFAVAATLLFTACEDKHIGRPCDLGVDNVTNTTVATVKVDALECPSRVCILPAQQLSGDTGALCTDGCGSDDDCSDGETRSAGNSKGCKSRFVCRTIIPQLDGNPLSCKPVCVCKDFLPTNDTGAKPLSCQ